MSAAASVRYPVGPSRRLRALLVGVSVLGSGLIVGWIGDGLAAQRLGLWPRAALLLSLQGLALLALWQFWRRLPRGWLAFGGEGWTLEREAAVMTTPPIPGRASIALDLQQALLIRVWEPGASRPSPTWVWADRVGDPMRWDALRGALYSRAALHGGVDTPAVTQPPAP